MIATHNRVGELLKTLASCLEQDWPAKEILVVDDASTDDTYERTRTQFPQVDIVRWTENRGSIAARNDILRRARGRYIIGLDDDSRFLEHDSCRRVVGRLESEPDLGIIAFQAVGPEFPQRLTPQGRLHGERHCSSFAACGVALRRAMLAETGLLPEFFEHMYEEPDLCLRAWDAGYRVLEWNDIVVYHEFSPLNRNEQRNHHRHARNEACSIWMRYPWPLVVPMTLARLASQARYAASRGWLLREPLIWLDFLRRLPRALQARQPVSTRAVKISLAVNRLETLEGERVWDIGEFNWMKFLVPRPCYKPHVLADKASQSPAVLVAHSGRQHAYQAALAVQRAGGLARFLTSGYYKPSQWPDRLCSGWRRLDALLRRRHLPALDAAKVVRRWDLELPELAARRLLGNGALTDRLVCHRDARFDRWIARRWIGRDDVYWGFQGSCLESLRAARRAGMLALVEFATAHVTLAIELLSAEAARHPEWADSIGNLHFPAWYRRRLEREPHEGDYCLAASDFTRRSLLQAGIADSRIKLLPLGADLEQFTFTPRSTTEPFRILFLGSVGQRKGIKYLLEAVRRLRTPAVELILVGPLMGSGKALAGYHGCYTYRGLLDRAAVIRTMRECHVLVLPSVFEGFGLVIPEAMASGMPVIASTHTAGPEMIRAGEGGFVLEPDDIDGLAAKLDWLAAHRADAVEMGAAAAAAAQAYSWDCYQARVRILLQEVWSDRCSTPAACGIGS